MNKAIIIVQWTRQKESHGTKENASFFIPFVGTILFISSSIMCVPIESVFILFLFSNITNEQHTFHLPQCMNLNKGDYNF